MNAVQHTNATDMVASYTAIRARLMGRSPERARAPGHPDPVAPFPRQPTIEPEQQEVLVERIAQIRKEAHLAHNWLHIDYTPLDTPITVLKAEWRRIVVEVAAKHRVTVMEIMGPHRRKDIVSARFEAYYRIRNETPLSHPEIARRLGGKDHTTVLYGIRKHIERRAAAGEIIRPIP